jgi:eukaryotic-like serine/threonine-protein kinase
MATQPQNWLKVKALFHEALELDSSSRSALLRDKCPDAKVRAEVQRLLAEHDQAGGFLSPPPLDDFPVEAETASQRLLEGELLAGRFCIVRFIGRGGMGEVYEAEDRELREHVAVKTIRAEFLSQSGALTRFRREVNLARKVTHSNVCRVFDLFRHRPERASVQEEIVFVTMELLYGKTLEQQLQVDGPFHVSEALPLVQQMASALAAAHAVGIVHRDFKPGNVLLVDLSSSSSTASDPNLQKLHAAKWRAVVTDFGLAHQSLKSEKSATLSTGQGLWGTPAYMSPEQLEGRPSTPASDIYALGLVMYEMVTGARPFQGDTPISVALKRLNETPPSPRNFQPKLNGIWESVILRCLERNPAQRFPTAQLVAEALVDTEPRLQKEARRRKTAATTEGGNLWRIGATVGLTALLLAGGLYYHSILSKHLTEKDTIVLADFVNSTGDAVFDDTLRTALNISLRQSPFLNVLSDSEVTKILQQMSRPGDTRLTPQVARDVCLRAASKAYIAGAIDSLGSEYVLGLKAVNCQNGDTLAEEQITTESKEKVLAALGNAANKLRSEVGESLRSVQKFDVPGEATTFSLEALKSHSIGLRMEREKGDAASIPFYKRAIELDPNFPLAYANLAVAYGNLEQYSLALEYATKAYQLRDRAGEKERLRITTTYFRATGETEKNIQTYELWLANYPRDSVAHGNLGADYQRIGQFDQALVQQQEALRLDPEHGINYLNLSVTLMALNRLQEAKAVLDQAFAHKLDSGFLRQALYLLAFLRGDTAQMEKQLVWSDGRPGDEDPLLSEQSDTEAYYGCLSKAREFSRRAVDSARRAGSKETAALWRINAALREAEVGNTSDAKRGVAAALALSSGRDVKIAAALIAASIGSVPRAEALAADLAGSFPSNSFLKFYWLPTIKARVEITRRQSSRALSDLETAYSYELGQASFINYLYPAYVRGQAYLLAGDGPAAATEFQKLLDHTGIVVNFVTGALARLGLARANALQAKLKGADSDAARARALAAYKDFLTLWKDADSDIPILKQAKAEYRRLQSIQDNVYKVGALEQPRKRVGDISHLVMSAGSRNQPNATSQVAF